MEDQDQSGIQSRIGHYPGFFSICLGILLSFFSAALIFLSATALYNQWKQSWPYPYEPQILGILLASGVFCSLLAWRLMTGRGSPKGGGILSPFGLALVGVIFLSLGVGFLVKGEWAALLFCALSAVLAFRAAVFRSRTTGLQFLSK